MMVTHKHTQNPTSASEKLHPNVIDLTSQEFNFLRVERFSHSHKRHAYWVCTCKCGTTTTVSSSNLRDNKVKSCGCFLAERNQEVHTTHGRSRTPLYAVWATIDRTMLSLNR